MAVAKKKKESAGAPEWMVTYGDMVTLLLTFFVLLLAMSEVKKEEQFVDFMQALRDAFGYRGGVQHVPIEDVNVPRNVNLTEMLIIPVHSHDFSKSPEPGIRGKQDTVSDIRRGDRFRIGGPIQFEPLSATLTAEQDDTIARFAESLRGFSTQIEIRGHASRAPIDGTEFHDHFDLAYRRARAVADALVRHGISRERLVLISTGTNEPLTAPVYTRPQLEENDFVELLQIDQHVDDFAREPVIGP